MNESLVKVREENPTQSEIAAIREVNQRAFGQDQEANIVDALRSHGALLHSFVATLNADVVGHVSYSPASINSLVGAALGPMAVLPQYQRKGIGSQLIEAGNARLRGEQCPFIIVVGHPDFYPRFGFVRASLSGMRPEWDLPDDVFMVRILDEERMRGVSGLVKYRQEFSTVL
jgi:putative acetyltransferase